MRKVLIPLFAASLMGAVPSGYQQELDQWRQAYQDGLRAPDGWLSLAGLSWLHEGKNTAGSDREADVVLPERFPARVGVVELTGNRAVFVSNEGSKTLEAEKDSIGYGDLKLALIARNHKFAIRVRDPQAATRVHFTGSKWFPVKPELRVVAKWIPYDPPRTVPILTVLGYVEQQPSPGVAEFTLQGRTFQLEPIVDTPGKLFFIFKDLTSGKESYAAARYLDADEPKEGKVILDFNQSRNPPCAFTPYATCPLPPKQNVMPVRIDAGELKYGNH